MNIHDYCAALGHTNWAAMPYNLAASFGLASMLAILLAGIITWLDNRANNTNTNYNLSEEDAMANANTETATRNFNLFSFLRGLGYGATDFCVGGLELSWNLIKAVVDMIAGLVAEVASAAWAFTKISAKIAATVAVVIVAVIAMTAWMTYTVTVGTVITAKDAIVSGYRKVTGWFSAKKAQAIGWVTSKRDAAKAAIARKRAAVERIRQERIAAAEALRVQKLKADAKIIGMVTSEEVAELVAQVTELKAVVAELRDDVRIAVDPTLIPEPKFITPDVDMDLEDEDDGIVEFIEHAENTVTAAMAEYDLATKEGRAEARLFIENLGGTIHKTATAKQIAKAIAELVN